MHSKMYVDSQEVQILVTDANNSSKNDKNWVTYFMCWMLTGIMIVATAILIVVLKHKRIEHNGINHVHTTLNLHDLVQNWLQTRDWNILQYDYGMNQTLYNEQDESIIVKYPRGSWAPSAGDTDGYGGFNFYAQPKPFPMTEVCLTYEVKFNKDFNWVKGGKLPGMWIGDIGASGGNHNNTGFSYRVAWHTGGNIEAYVYVPDNQTNQLYIQPGYISNDVYGDSLWRGLSSFVTDEWYSISLYIKLNSFKTDSPNQDGIIGLQVNKSFYTFNKFIWTNNPNHTVNGIMMDTFFGGSDKTWATPITTFAYFRNFIVNDIAC